MNAKQAEELTGISRRNLRFYEQQGLINPKRNPDNDYRDYSEEDIEVLKKIRALRMLDVPLDAIGDNLRGDRTLKSIMEQQEKLLKKKQQEVETALKFCRELQRGEADVDALLKRMDAPEIQGSLFNSWVRDYQSVARAEARRNFNFIPDDAVTTPAEFTMALFKYGEETGKDLVVTKEGMVPEFTLDGIEYKAQRIYRPMGYMMQVPVAVILCQALHPEDFTTEMGREKSKVMGLIYHWWWVLLVVAFEGFTAYRSGLTAWWAILLIALSVTALAVVNAVVYKSWSK